MPRPLAALAVLFAVVIIGAGALLYQADRRAVRELAQGPVSTGPESTEIAAAEQASAPAAN